MQRTATSGILLRLRHYCARSVGGVAGNGAGRIPGGGPALRTLHGAGFLRWERRLPPGFETTGKRTPGARGPVVPRTGLLSVEGRHGLGGTGRYRRRHLSPPALRAPAGALPGNPPRVSARGCRSSAGHGPAACLLLFSGRNAASRRRGAMRGGDSRRDSEGRGLAAGNWTLLCPLRRVRATAAYAVSGGLERRFAGGPPGGCLGGRTTAALPNE